MKKFLGFCLFAFAGYMGWFRYGGTKTPTTETPTATPQVASVTPAPTPKRRLAPDGTFFLLTYQSVMTEKGVTGFPPGTQVTAVSDLGTTLAVRADSQNLTVAKSEVTNDLNVATAVLRADSAEQSALFAKGLAQSNAAAEAKAKELRQEAENLNRRLAMASQPQYVARSSNPLDRGAYGQTDRSREVLRGSTGGYVMSPDGGAISMDEAMKAERAQRSARDFQRTQIDILSGNISAIRNSNPRDPNLSRLDSQLMQLRNAAGQ